MLMNSRHCCYSVSSKIVVSSMERPIYFRTVVVSHGCASLYPDSEHIHGSVGALGSEKCAFLRPGVPLEYVCNILILWLSTDNELSIFLEDYLKRYDSQLPFTLQIVG